MVSSEWFYKFDTYGKNGKPITVTKVRTMIHGADEMLEEIVHKNGYNEKLKPNNDPRVIPSRAWLRKYHLDDLPQILSVLKGEMSLVGIRPLSEFAFYRNPPIIPHYSL